MTEKDWAKFWLALIAALLVTIVALVVQDNWTLRKMTAAGFCYERSEVLNDKASWAWKKCK